MTIEYRTVSELERRLRVRYPPGEGRLVLRTELDWERDVEPVEISEDGTTSTFLLRARQPFLYFKPCLRRPDGTVRWAAGENLLALMTNVASRDVFPFFDGSSKGSLSDVIELESPILGRKHLVRVYLPPGYHQNSLQRLPVLYMQDGKNLFFPDEAFLGREWQVDEALQLLDQTSGMERVAVVGVHSGDRMAEYTKPGYETYARAVVEEVKPTIDSRFRLKTAARDTGVVGSSLGGVVSFYMAWEYPEVFGHVACMSSTFSFRDDLIDRVLAEPKRSSRIYLDSGWPSDNYEVTLAMAMALVRRGYRVREEFLHLVFPLEKHDENAWGRRLHIPLQLGMSLVTSAARTGAA